MFTLRKNYFHLNCFILFHFIFNALFVLENYFVNRNCLYLLATHYIILNAIFILYFIENLISVNKSFTYSIIICYFGTITIPTKT
jgi:hypothetical protein